MEFKQLDIFIKCFFFFPTKKEAEKQANKKIHTNKKKAHVGLGGKEMSVVNFTPKI